LISPIACAQGRSPEQRKKRIGLQPEVIAEEPAPFGAAAFAHPGQEGTGAVDGM